MSIDTFKSNWMTEEHEMVYESALKMFQSWEEKTNNGVKTEKLIVKLGMKQVKWAFYVPQCLNSMVAVVVILVTKLLFF